MLGGIRDMVPRENFEKNGAIWRVLKCNLEENVMKISNKMCKTFYLLIIIHINKTITIINYLHN